VGEKRHGLKEASFNYLSQIKRERREPLQKKTEVAGEKDKRLRVKHGNKVGQEKKIRKQKLGRLPSDGGTGKKM